jgi:hypothetical protein
MKIINTIAAITIAMLISAPAMAGNSNAEANASTSSSSQQGNEQAISTTNYGSDLSDQVPAVVAPSLTTTLSETCMGSTSMGIAGAGFGISFGSTWKDEACVRRLDSRELRSFGAGLAPNDAILFHFAAKERMCADPKIRAAFERVYMMTDRKDALCQATSDDHVAAQAQRDANKIAGTGNTTGIYYVEDQRTDKEVALARKLEREERRNSK